MNRLELLRLLALGSMGSQLPYSLHGKSTSWLGQSDHNRKPFTEEKLHLLWYWQPAQDWKSALPVGNGRMGGLIKGTAKKEEVLINNEGEYKPIFYNGQRLKLVKYNTVWLSSTPNKPSKSRDDGYTRICTWGLFKDRESGDRFYV